MNHSELRAVLEHAWCRTLRDLDPARLVSRCLRDSFALNVPHRVTVVAAGKAAPRMAKGAIDAFGDSTRGLVVTTDGTQLPVLPDAITVMRASHPIPDRRSVAAALSALQLAHTSSDDLMLALISGGTSSLLCLPSGLSLDEKQASTDELLRSGADIHELNTVRRHLSGIKGGRLAAAFRGAVHCVIVSDVVGGDAHEVGSGPACIDPTTVEDARRIVRKYLSGDLASACEAACSESVKRWDAGGRTCALLAGPEDLARLFARRLSETGWTMRTSSRREASAEELSEMLVLEARALEAGHGSVVASEPTLSVPRDAGRGGRAGWVALNTLVRLPSDVVLWAAASDGVDGSSGHGGACVSGSMRLSLDPAVVESHLVARDDASVHESMGTSLRGGPTGTNLADVYAVFRVR